MTATHAVMSRVLRLRRFAIIDESLDELVTTSMSAESDSASVVVRLISVGEFLTVLSEATHCCANYPVRRCRDDQWMAEILQPCGVRTSTMSSAPVELMARPFISPCVVLVPLVQATSPRMRTCTGPR